MGVLRMSWGALGASWANLMASWRRPGGVLGGLEAFGERFGASGGRLGASWDDLLASRAQSESKWDQIDGVGSLGCVLGRLGTFKASIGVLKWHLVLALGGEGYAIFRIIGFQFAHCIDSSWTLLGQLLGSSWVVLEPF